MNTPWSAEVLTFPEFSFTFCSTQHKKTNKQLTHLLCILTNARPRNSDSLTTEGQIQMQTSVWWQQARDVGSDAVPAVPELVLVRQAMKPVVKVQQTHRSTWLCVCLVLLIHHTGMQGTFVHITGKYDTSHSCLWNWGRFVNYVTLDILRLFSLYFCFKKLLVR